MCPTDRTLPHMVVQLIDQVLENQVAYGEIERLIENTLDLVKETLSPGQVSLMLSS
jgi:hypothetical protein